MPEYNTAFYMKQKAKSFLQNHFLPAVYRRAARGPVDHRLVILADAHHESRPESMDRLAQALAGTEFHLLEFYRDFGKMGAKAQLSASIEFMKLYASAGCVVICDNFLPASSCKKRKETKLIQLWHGPGAFKKFGYDAKDDIPPFYKGNVYANYDLVTVSGPACVGPFSHAMAQPEGVVQPLGISRMDRCFEEGYQEACREEFLAAYPEASGKKVLLWAPTFRGNAGDPYLIGLEAMERLKAELGEEWFVIFSLHPHLLHHMERDDLVTRMPTERMIPAADLFMTDYSSVMYDACLAGKKMMIFAPDLEEFLTERGTYMDLPEFPGQIVTREEDLLPAVRQAGKTYDWEKQKKFTGDYLSACDGHATDRILEWIRK